MATKKQVDEAKLRMEHMVVLGKANPDMIMYLNKGKVCYSHMLKGNIGCIDIIDNKPDYVTLIRKFEEDNSAYVYHVIESETAFGIVLALLYVSEETYDYLHEWSMQRFVYIEGTYDNKSIYSYTYYVDYKCGESGYIDLYIDNGALVNASAISKTPDMRCISNLKILD